jgi:predicted transcriptional regulator
VKTAKQEARELLDRLPDDVSMDVLLAELVFKASVLRGLEESHRGEFVTQDEAKRRLSRWLASSGH